jgi:hypothetical protein
VDGVSGDLERGFCFVGYGGILGRKRFQVKSSGGVMLEGYAGRTQSPLLLKNKKILVKRQGRRIL